MSKQIISTSQRAGRHRHLFAGGPSGQYHLGLRARFRMDPATKELVKGDMEAQVRRAFDNLKAIVLASGATLDDVVKANIFMTDLSHFALVNKIMAEYFREPYPARAAVGVASLPRGAQFEVECIVAL